MILLKLVSMLLVAYVYYTEATPHRFVQPIDETPAFLRFSVENIPNDDEKKMSLRLPSYNDVEGIEETHFFRGAVESIPKTVVSDYRPLRLAVEYNPKEEEFSRIKSRQERFLDIVVPDRQQFSRAYDLQAYVVPIYNIYDNDPTVYRTGSPYQQIIDIREFEKLQTEPTQQIGNSKMFEEKKMDEKYRVVCFFSNWAFYRKEDGRFVPENLDYKLCTEVVYAFASLDAEELIIREFDPWVDFENNLYQRTIDLANGIPVYLGMGGWTDSIEGKYSKLVSDKRLRDKFIDNAVPFLKRFGFSGLHIDWNYPTCPQSDCGIGDENDKKFFTTFIKELKQRLKQSDLKLSISVSGYREIIIRGYDFKELSKHVEFINVMTYDYHGAWEPVTGHVSPLHGSEKDKYPQYNTAYAIKLLIELGASPEKLIMGIPFYGQSFTLKSSSNQGFNAPAQGPGAPGDYTNQPGMLAYYEICNLLRRPNYKKGVDSSGNSGPYATDGRTWAGYDDQASILKKTKYVIDNELGGISAWTIDLDDFNNICCSESFPLLKSINRGLGRIKTKMPTGHDCTKPTVVTPKPAVMVVTEDSGQAGIPEQSSTSGGSYWTSSTTRRPAIQTTSRRPSQQSTEKPPKESTAIPAPVNVMPVYVASEKCQNGDYKRYPGSCTMYLVCVGNTYLAQPCPQGLHWNDDHKHCDWPSSAKCQVIPPKEESKTTTTTTERSTKYTTKKTTEATRPPTIQSTRSTTRATRSTSRFTKRTTQRPTTILYDPTERTTTTYSETTEYFTTTKRPTRKSTTKRPTTQSTTTTPTTTKKPSKKPMKCENGEYYPHKDCTKYYICTNNRRVSQQCPDHLQFSQKYKICDFEENVKCVSRKKYMKLLQRQYERTGVFTASLLRAKEGDPCEGRDFLAFPGKCSLYLRCDHEQLLALFCSEGTFWNSDKRICDHKTNVECEDDPSLDEEGEEIEEEEEESENELETIDESSEVSSSASSSTTTRRPQSTTTTKKPQKPTKKPSKPPLNDPATSDLETIPVSDNVQPLTGKYKLLCYFTNWAWYRPGDGKYLPDDIDANLCTHVIYGFAVLDYDQLTIKPHDTWADFDNRFYERVLALKSKGVKVTLAIGGWNDSAGDKYSRLVRSAAARARFIKHVVEFLEKYGFEGLDLDWEYPVCWQVDCKKGYPDEKKHFASFVRELSAAFKPKGLLLSAAVSPSKTVIDAGYDVAEISKYMDWIAVMTYDFHGQWDKKTGHVAPLYYHPEDDVDFFNSDYTIKYWLKLGAPKNKIVMGMPLYGQSFTLADPVNHGLNAKAPGPGQAGEFTRAAGFLSYYEICDRIFNRGWKVVQDPENRLGPYAYKDNQWVSFDDQAMLKRKTQYIKDMGIAGGMIWALDLDDFRGKCGQGKHPLLKIIHAGLQSDVLEDSEEEAVGEEEGQMPEQKPQPETPTGEFEGEVDYNQNEIGGQEPDDNEESEAVDEEDYEDDEENEIDEYDGQYKVVCYFTNWAWYRQGIGKYKPEDIDPKLCTHIVYGFAVLNRDTLTIQPHDSWADIDNNFYAKVVEYKKHGIKVTVAIGGWNDSAGDKYSRLVRSAAARARFIKHVIEFIEKYGFDGLDLDWEYPVCWQVDCTKGKEDEKENFALFVEELSDAFRPKGLLLSTAVSPSKKVIDAAYDIPRLSERFDWISLMAYDYHGQWDKKTGHVAPMYVHPSAWEKTFNTNFSTHYWILNGADPRKIILGMPMYGQSFSLADRTNTGLNSPTYGGGEAGEETRARGFLSYYEICSRIKRKGWNVVKDSRGTIGPYAYLGDQWVSFDDVNMIRHKSEFVKALGLGGAMIWALDLDDFKNSCNCEEYPLLRTINRVLRNYPGTHNNCNLESRITPPKPTAEETTRRTPTTVAVTNRPTKKTTTSTMKVTSTTFEGEDYEEEYPELDDEGGCVAGMYYSDPNECDKYYVCNHNEKVENRCPGGLHWNQDKKICDWPSNANCVLKDEEQEIDNDVIEPESGVSKPTKKPVSTTSKPTTTTTKRPPPKPTRPPVQSDPIVPTGNNAYKVMCYFTNWAWYRPGIGKYKPSDIDETLCTHIIYGFAVLNGQTLTIRTHDSWADIDNNFYTQVSSLKEKGIKVSIAIGGWNDSLGDKYSRLVRDPEARRKFIEDVIKFMKKYGFEGLDLDWEYPVCWQVDCTKGKPEEKEAFAAFVEELYEAFQPDGFLLSAAVSPAKKVIDAGYDIPKLSKYFDWIAVMTYDYHGQWDKMTGHVAPLYVHEDDSDKTFNANWTMHYWISNGAPRSKLVMGMPMYGQSFTLEKASNNGLNAKAPGPGTAGEFTRSAGFLAFYEICHKINGGGWTVVKDPNGVMGPYAYNDRQWVSYDDVEQIRRKTKLVKDMNLAGAMIWALDLDDFRNRCGCGYHPLLSTINLELNRITTTKLSDCT